MKRIAVIGSGVSGAVAARLLATRHDVTLFESAPTPGGHARTVEVDVSGRRVPVDTGFMVYNERTYPNFSRLLKQLGVESRPSDMSFSVRCDRTGLEYQGSSLNGLFAQRWNAAKPDFWKMLRDVSRFNARGLSAARTGELEDGRTVRQFLADCRVGERFVSHYLVPMAAAIWSSAPRAVLGFPAEFLIGFFANHGLLQLRDRPQWRTIRGGSRVYVDKLLAPLGEQVRLACPVESVARTESEALITTAGSPVECFEEVVFACHADQALRLLSDATPVESDVLSAFPYQSNHSVLHTDASLLPDRRRAWASWNYHLPSAEARTACVTYDLSRLQGHLTPSPLLLTLNATQSINPAKVIQTHTFRHPAYSTASIAAQRRWAEVSGRGRTHFCGAYWGYGFHEDGVNSALAVANSFGVGIEACGVACTRASSGWSACGCETRAWSTRSGA